jgi:uncharacterized protein
MDSQLLRQAGAIVRREQQPTRAFEHEPSRVESPLAAATNHHPLIANHLDDINHLCQHYGVRSLAVFGSILREDFDGESSDVDFAVRFDFNAYPSPARQYFDFKSELERVLGRPVDLVEIDSMPETRLKRIIQRTQVRVFGGPL